LLFVLAAVTVVTTSFAPASATSNVSASASASRPPRVLLIGDSIMDQEGSHAAVLLREAGAQVKVVGVWGSSLMTRGQYDMGRVDTAPAPGEPEHWLSDAAHLVETFHPDLVAVHLNYNYWPPFPRDASGRDIKVGTRPFFRMVASLTTTLVTRLRAGGARVAFVAPLPDAHGGAPASWNKMWAAYLPVLQKLDVPIVDPAAPIAGRDGVRVESEPDCAGLPTRVRLDSLNLHLTRFGAGLTGTRLARGIAALVHLPMPDSNAPGQRTVAVVTAGADGYWLVGCDGSIYAFGSAPHLNGAVSARSANDAVVGAAAAPGGRGIWMATRSGRVLSSGVARAGEVRIPLNAPVVGMAATPSGRGYWLVASDGGIFSFGDARFYGSTGNLRLNQPVVGMAPTPSGRGYWLVASDGGIFSFGDARFYGSTGNLRLNQPVFAMATTSTGHGYWLVAADGGIFTFGHARFEGSAVGRTLARPVTGVARTGADGLWVVTDTGRIVGLGTRTFGATARLALFTE
jgi:hypothetical protein